MTGRYLRLLLVVTDMKTSQWFYENVLGFSLLNQYPDGYHSFTKGSVIIALSEQGSEAAAFEPAAASRVPRGRGMELIIEVADLDEEYMRVTNSQWGNVEPKRLQPWDLRDFRVTDPDGYYWCVTETDVPHEFES